MFGRKTTSGNGQEPTQGPVQLPALTAQPEDLSFDDDKSDPSANAKETIRQKLFRSIDPGAALRMPREKLREQVRQKVSEIASEERLQLNEKE